MLFAINSQAFALDDGLKEGKLLLLDL